MSAQLKVAVIISGGGSNLKALITAAEKPDCAFRIVHVVSNKADAGGLAHAAAGGIPATVIDHKAFPSRETFDAALDALPPAQTALECAQALDYCLSQGSPK